jgi:hypothetical protein
VVAVQSPEILKKKVQMQSHDDFDPIAIPEHGDMRELFRLDDFNALRIDPTNSTQAPPGSDDKVLMLSARYAAGLSLWDARDRCHHGPRVLIMDAEVG